MSGIVKSFSFPKGEIRGDMFYIKHLSNNFSVIDCYLKEGEDESCRHVEILREIKNEVGNRKVRFLSTHPDADHILGIEKLFEQWGDRDFYAVANDIKAEDGNKSLDKYIALKASQSGPIDDKFSEEGMTRGKDCCGLLFLWPQVENERFKQALKGVEDGESPNDISFVMRYSVDDGARYLWMGDMETGMQEEFCKCVSRKEIESIDVLFHPHHGRKSSAPPDGLLNLLDPQVIVIGNAPCDDINYDHPEKTITQNIAGDIVFVNESGKKVHVYTTNDIDNRPEILRKENGAPTYSGLKYQGSFTPRKH